MALKQIRVQASHTYLNKFDQVAQGIKDAGMTVQDEILSLGHFKGLADDQTIERIKSLPGVASISVTGEEGDTEQNDYIISN